MRTSSSKRETLSPGSRRSKVNPFDCPQQTDRHVLTTARTRLLPILLVILLGHFAGTAVAGIISTDFLSNTYIVSINGGPGGNGAAAIFDALDRCGTNVFLYTSSPGVRAGRFYESHTKLKDFFVVVQAGLKDCPHIPRAKIEDNLPDDNAKFDLL